MAVQPNVVSPLDVTQAFLAAQKQNQDLVKSALETMRLQQDVDDRKRQNQWNNTWDVLQKMADKTAGGMAGLIGQNQDLIKQLFQSNGMTKNQAGLAVDNLAKTLLTPEAQAQLRISKYMMDPYAMVNEVVETQPEPPAQVPEPVKETKPGKEVSGATPPSPAPEQPKPVSGDPYSGLRFAFTTQFNLSRNATGGSFALNYDPKQFRSYIDEYNRRVDTVEGYKGLPKFDLNKLVTILGGSGAYPSAKSQDEILKSFLTDLQVVYSAKNGDPVAQRILASGSKPGSDMAARYKIASTLLSETNLGVVMAGSTEEESMRKFREGTTIAPSAAPQAKAEAAQSASENPADYKDFTSYVMRNPVAAESIKKAWKMQEGESEEAYRKRVEPKVIGANSGQYNAWLSATGAKNAEEQNPDKVVNPAAAAETSKAGAIVSPPNVVKLAATSPGTPQGQKAIEYINTQGRKVEMKFDEMMANRANNTPMGKEEKAFYVNYMDKMSASAEDWLSKFAPLTDEYLRRTTGKSDVGEAYQDLLALGIGGAEGWQGKREMELQAASMKDTMERFAATFGLDQEKFEWQKQIDTMQLALNEKELQIKMAGASGTPQQLFLKSQLAIIEDTLKLSKETDPAKRWNWVIKTYNADARFRDAWDTYLMWQAASLGMKVDKFQEQKMSLGWFGQLYYSIRKQQVPSIPVLSGPPQGAPEGSATGSAAANAVGEKYGIK